jgi:predicted permease
MIMKRRVIWLGILVSTFIYGGVIVIVTKPYPQLPLSDVLQQPFVLTLYGIGLVTYVASFLVSASMERRGKRDSAFIVRLVLLEAVTVYGLVAAFLVHDWRVFIPPFVLTFIGLARVFPSPTVDGRIS